jgi:hypothetical protein
MSLNFENTHSLQFQDKNSQENWFKYYIIKQPHYENHKH